MDIVFLVIFFTLVGGAVGFSYGFRFAQEKIMTELTDMVLENIVDLTHEVVENQHYLYYKDTDEFASQGSTLDEAAKNFSIRDNGVGRLETSLGKHVFIVDGKLETQ
jgi:hypothetical protein